MKPRHLVWSSDLSKKEYDEIFRRADIFVKRGVSPDLLPGKIVATLYFQPSTRTMNAFQSAMLRAGGGWIGVMGEKGLSMEKGEDLVDTIRAYSECCDVIVMRHPDDNSAEIAAAASSVPFINSGSGSKEHAVGTAMMLYAIYYYTRRLEGLKVGIYGTPEINRVTKAMVPIMGYYGMKIVMDDLGHFPLPKDIEERAKKNGLAELRYDKLDNFIGDVDVLICTRGLQKGIIPEGKFPKEKEELILKSYKPITTEHMKRLRKDAVLDMITPRIFEIDRSVDSDPRAIYSKKRYFTELVLAVMTHLLDVKV